MTDKVQKIRNEVEKLKSNLMYGACSSQVAMETRCKEEAYNEVLSIMDSMQKEPKECMYSKDNYTAEDRKVLCEGCEEECEFNKKEESASEEQVKESLISKHDDKTCKENGNSLTQEPMSEIDFEQELYKYFGQVKDFTLGMTIAKRFYQIGRNYQEPVNDNFEAEVKKLWEEINTGHSYSIVDSYNIFYGLCVDIAEWQKEQILDSNTTLQRTFELGKQEMKQQLMAKAVDGLVVCNNFTHGYKDILMEIPSYLNVDDKVKVIILKEN